MLRIFIVDHFAVARLGLRQALLQASSPFQVVGEAASLSDVDPALARQSLDLLVCEAMTPQGSSFRFVRPLLKDAPNLKVVFLTSCEEASYRLEAARCGAYGLLSKNLSQSEIVTALERVGQGRRLCEASPSRYEGLCGYLSNREEEVVCCLARGMRVKDMALHLGVSQKTIEAHKTNIMKKLDLHSQVALIRWAVQQGLILP